MPRTITSGERDLLAADHANFWLRVETKDSTDTWRDLTNDGGVNWVIEATWGESIDAATATGSVTLKREAEGVSIVPFVDTSPLNSPGPLLNVGREIRFSTAVTAAGTAPVSGDWKEMLLGKVTDLDPHADPLVLTVADDGARVLDAQIEAVREYGDPGGALVEGVMQKILDDNLGAGTIMLAVPVPPTDSSGNPWVIVPYLQDLGSILDALHTLVLQFGWDVRYRYDAADVSALTLISPDRAKTTPDFTIGPSEYLDVVDFKISDADIRNIALVTYQDKETLAVGSAEASDPGSIAEFGRKWMGIGEGSANNIDTYDEALAMAEAAVSDLSQPIADQSVEQFYFWPLQLGDLIQYNANGVHYTADQQFGVVSYQHTVGVNTHRTTIAVRGKVAGAYRRWLLTRNGQYSGALNTGPAPIIPPLQAEFGPAFEDPAREGMAWQQVIFEKACAQIDIYGMESAAAGVPVPELAANRLCYSLQRQEGDLWNQDAQAFIVGIATRPGYYRKTVSIGTGYDGTRGPTTIWEKQAVDVGTPPSAPPTALTVEQSGTTNHATWTTGDPDAYTILFRNGYGIVLEPGVNAILDTNVNAEIEYHYQVCHWLNGQTSALADGVVVPPATSSATAPTWDAGYPAPSGTNGVEFRWHADPSTTRIVIELSTFTIIGLFAPLAGGVFDDPDSHVPNGTYIDTSYPAGTRLQARIKATVAGVDYYSTPVYIVYGAPIVAPTFYGGTPWNFAGNVNIQWRTASTAATSLIVLLLAEPAVGITPPLPGGVLYTETSGALIQAGSVDIANPTTILGGSIDLTNRRVELIATYTGGNGVSRVARINVAP